jgi:hypothetical protein
VSGEPSVNFDSRRGRVVGEVVGEDIIVVESLFAYPYKLEVLRTLS